MNEPKIIVPYSDINLYSRVSRCIPKRAVDSAKKLKLYSIRVIRQHAYASTDLHERITLLGWLGYYISRLIQADGSNVEAANAADQLRFLKNSPSAT